MSDAPPLSSPKQQMKKRNIWQATHCSMNFLILYISFNTVQSLQSQALEDNGLGKLGFWSLAIMYLSIAIGSIFTTVILNRIGPIKCMSIGSLFNTPYVFAMALASIKGEYLDGDRSGPPPFYTNTYFVSSFIMVLSIFNGLGQAVQWVGQGNYMSDCATEETKGFFFSYFWAFYMSSPIFGSLIAAYCLKHMDEITLFTIMGFISFLASVSAFFLRQPIVDELSSITRHSIVTQHRATVENELSHQRSTQ